MKVFIVEQGEFCEGSVICGVFSTVKKALNYVGTHFDGRWKLSGENKWEFGCEYVEINEYEVE